MKTTGHHRQIISSRAVAGSDFAPEGVSRDPRGFVIEGVARKGAVPLQGRLPSWWLYAKSGTGSVRQPIPRNRRPHALDLGRHQATTELLGGVVVEGAVGCRPLILERGVAREGAEAFQGRDSEGCVVGRQTADPTPLSSLYEGVGK